MPDSVPRKALFWRVLWWVVVALAAAFLLWLVLVGVPAAQRAARREYRCNQMKHIGVGLHNFQDVHGFFSPAVRRDEYGRPLSSWRFQIVPFLEAVMLGIDYGTRWDDPENRSLCFEYRHFFCTSGNSGSPEGLNTGFVAVTGPGTAFEDGKTFLLGNIPLDTILVIEIAHSDTHWAEPGDISIDDMPQSITEGLYGYGVHVLFADGSVWFLGSDVPLDDLKKFCTIEGAKKFNRQRVLWPYVE